MLRRACQSALSLTLSAGLAHFADMILVSSSFFNITFASRCCLKRGNCYQIFGGTRVSLVQQVITKTYLYNFDPLKPHFYIVKLGFTAVYIIFLISIQNIDCGYLLEPPRRGGSNEYPQSMF